MNFPAETQPDTMRVVNTPLVGMRKRKKSENSGGSNNWQCNTSLWSKLPREEKLFQLDPVIRNRLAIFLHDRHPRTAHPPKPTQFGVASMNIEGRGDHHHL